MWLRGPKPTIGLVGAIGAGKTTVSQILESRGGYRIDADKLGHQALESPSVKDHLIERWGEGILRKDGGVDRRAVGKIVFSNPDERQVLERLVFPEISAAAIREIEKGQEDSAAHFVVVDAAVMLEAGWNKVCDRMIYIDASKRVRQRRVFDRSGWSPEELASRESAQWDAERKKSHCDHMIYNEQGLPELELEIDRMLKELGLQPTLPRTTDRSTNVPA